MNQQISDQRAKLSQKVDLSLVLACYNEEAVIVDSVRQIHEVLDHTVWSYEIIFVDDCSEDRTRELIQEILDSDSEHKFQCIFHEKNTGRGGAVSDGMRVAKGDIVGYIDIDLEVHARYIPSCLLAVGNGFDIATAHRIYKFYWRGLIRWILSKGYKWLSSLILSMPFQDSETGFKFFSRSRILPILDEIEDKGWFWDTEVMVRSYLRNYRINEIPCLFERRFDKQSTVNLVDDTFDYFNNLWRFRQEVRRLRQGAHAL
jgi:glycosyltransferase involved in cell wall biosynthesis